MTLQEHGGRGVGVELGRDRIDVGASATVQTASLQNENVEQDVIELENRATESDPLDRVVQLMVGTTVSSGPTATA